MEAAPFSLAPAPALPVAPPELPRPDTVHVGQLVQVRRLVSVMLATYSSFGFSRSLTQADVDWLKQSAGIGGQSEDKEVVVQQVRANGLSSRVASHMFCAGL